MKRKNNPWKGKKENEQECSGFLLRHFSFYHPDKKRGVIDPSFKNLKLPFYTTRKNFTRNSAEMI